MKVRVDAERCQGHNRCYALAPELFDVDDFGMSSARGDGEVPPELEEKARLAECGRTQPCIDGSSHQKRRTS